MKSIVFILSLCYFLPANQDKKFPELIEKNQMSNIEEETSIENMTYHDMDKKILESIIHDQWNKNSISL